MYELSLTHIYPKLLNSGGDNGNILTLAKRCEWRNIKLKITEFQSKENLPANSDIYYLGGAEGKQQLLAINELLNQKETFCTASEQNAIILGVNGGYQLLGKYFETPNKEKVQGLNLLDIYTLNNTKRFTGNVTADFNGKILVGFENHSGRTFLNDGTEKFSTITIGNGNNGKDKTEGARKQNIFGTYLQGPFLPKNPQFADYLIELALQKKYKEKIELKKLDDKIEALTHNSLIGKKY